jgi:molybdopterin synthase catalytic subunit
MKNSEFRITTDSLEKPAAHLPIEGYGALVEFLGVVRGEEEGKVISALRYEAYGEMAAKVGQKLVEEVASKHDILAMEVIHRIGEIKNGETSLRICVYSKHRKAAFAACTDFIDRLKQDVPIWKHPISKSS